MSVNKISDETRTQIRNNSVVSLPSNPSERGVPSHKLQEMFVNPCIGEKVSMYTEINRIVDEVNADIRAVNRVLCIGDRSIDVNWDNIDWSLFETMFGKDWYKKGGHFSCLGRANASTTRYAFISDYGIIIDVYYAVESYNSFSARVTIVDGKPAMDGVATVDIGATSIVFDQKYNIGDIYTSMDSASPASRFGGTWERFAPGKVLVGLNENDVDFNAVGKTGGEKKHTQTLDELVNHRHFNNGGNTQIASGTYNYGLSNEAGYGYFGGDIGGGQPFNILQPYIVVNIWRRVA